MDIQLNALTKNEAQAVVASLLKEAERAMIVAAFNVEANRDTDEDTVKKAQAEYDALVKGIARIRATPAFQPYLPTHEPK